MNLTVSLLLSSSHQELSDSLSKCSDLKHKSPKKLMMSYFPKSLKDKHISRASEEEIPQGEYCY